jgi:hypothetical protein
LQVYAVAACFPIDKPPPLWKRLKHVAFALATQNRRFPMNEKLQELRTEVEDLRGTVNRLQNDNGPRRRVLGIGLGILLGLVLARLPNNEARAVLQDDKELVCKSLRVVGPDGKNMVTLGTDEDGGIMQVFGMDGKIRTIVAVAPKQGGGLLNLFDTNKKLRLVMEASDQGAVIEKR